MKNDKILVLTPQHPIDIVDANMELADYDAMSIQMMAMLAEETYRGEPKNEAEAPYMNKDYKYWDALFLNVEKTAKTRIPRIYSREPMVGANRYAGSKTEAFNALPSWNDKYEFIKNGLTPASFAVFDLLPVGIQQQLFLERDPHGNVQVSLIESEKVSSSVKVQ